MPLGAHFPTRVYLAGHSIPIGYTEETWQLGQRLPIANVLALAGISILFIGIFVYVNFYQFYLKGWGFEYIKRVLAIYVLSLLVVGILLTPIVTGKH